MGVVGVILLVAFVIVCILLVAIVLIQNEEGDGLGGMFGGAAAQAFGAKSGNILTKTTYVLVTLFFVACLALALMNRAPSVKSLDGAVMESAEATGTAEYWLDETPAAAPAEMSAADAE